MYKERKPQRRGGNSRFRSNRRGNSRRRFAKPSSIHHSKFINKNPKVQEIESYEATHTFADFGFHSYIVDNLTKIGYKKPTRIQDEATPHILAKKDVIGLANTGSGKTAAFVLPIIHQMKTARPSDWRERESALIVAPTRELAQQIEEEFRKFSVGMHLYSVTCVGGLNIRPQIRGLKRNPHVIIGTPGRLKDLIERKVLDLSRTSVFVLDEADRMLDMGFLPDIRKIISHLPEQKQSLCFSATITPEIKTLLDQLLNDPVTISVRTSETGEHIAQDVIHAGTKEEKMKELKKMLSQDHFEKTLVFGAMKYSVQRLADDLAKEGFAAVAIHGGKNQSQRQYALKKFKSGEANILVATDVAARGLDIPNVSHVINFDQPQTHEEYIHRIGRTGRAGKLGQAYTFISKRN